MAARVSGSPRDNRIRVELDASKNEEQRRDERFVIMESEHIESDGELMRHRQITLVDGRYMIFYTFGQSEPTSPIAREVNPTKPASTSDQEKSDV